MENSDIPDFDSFEKLLDDEGIGLFDSINPHTHQQALTHAQEIIPPQCLDQYLQLSSQSCIDGQNHIDNPVQLEVQPQTPSQTPLENMNPHYEQPTPFSDAKGELEYFRGVLRKLQSQANDKEGEMQVSQLGLETNTPVQTDLMPESLSELLPELQPGQLQLRTEHPELLSDDQINAYPDRGFEDLLRHGIQLRTPMHVIPPPNLVADFPDPSTYSQRVDMGTNVEDMEVDEIQPNRPPEPPKQKKSRRRETLQFTNQNSSKLNGVAKIIIKNTTMKPKSGVKDNVDKTLRVARSEPQVRCPSCRNKFPDWHAVRRHFRMIHASTSTKSKVCQECLQSFSSKTKLRRHWKRAHVGELDFVCEACGARFSKKRNLTLHRTNGHVDNPVSSWKITRKHKCKLCDFTADRQLTIVAHLFGAHNDAVDVECPAGCGGIFKSISNAKVHYFNCTHGPFIDK